MLVPSLQEGLGGPGQSPGSGKGVICRYPAVPEMEGTQATILMKTKSIVSNMKLPEPEIQMGKEKQLSSIEERSQEHTGQLHAPS